MTHQARHRILFRAAIFSLIVAALFAAVLIFGPELAVNVDSEVPRDSIIRELANIADSANQYRRLPASAGGGNGSYLGFRMPKLQVDTWGGFSFRIISVSSDSIMVEGQYKGKENGAVRALIDTAARPRNWQYFGDYQ
jgi:hypothetical protein